MRTSRLEAFSDGVLAIIITIMVLELHVPEEPTWESLGESGTSFLTYLLSFVYVGIYWNNHHHLFQLTERVSGAVLWANLHLLFWLSLMPFSTAWLDEQWPAEIPVVVYGINLLLAAVAYLTLQQAIYRAEGPGSRLREAIGGDLKGKASMGLYVTGILVAAVATWAAIAFFVAVAVIWLVPDTRLERYLASQGPDPESAA